MATVRAIVDETAWVAALNHDGEGVVRDGKTAFVAGALPGEEVLFRRGKRHRGHDDGWLLRVLTPSAQRVAPACKHFGTCGGCTLQHLDHEAQLAAKDEQLHDALVRVGKVTPLQRLAPLRGPIWNYRRRARLGARYVRAQDRTLVGFRERLTSYIAAIDRCEVLAPPVGGMIAQLSDLVSHLSIRDRLPQVEVAIGDAQVALVLRILAPLTEPDVERLRAFELQHRVTFYLQSGSPDDLQTLGAGAEPLYYDLPEFAVRLQFRPGAFVQVNAAVNRLLVARVVELLQLDAASRVVDLYCGLGNFTLPLARRAAAVIGIEGDAGLVACARDNAAANGLGNVSFAAANLAGTAAAAGCAGIAAAVGDVTHVLLDPPRTGARDILPAIAQLAPRRVVYVSCHPGSLARDLGELVHDHGYTLAAAGIVDMFPHTNHVESVAVLDGPGSRS
ncbi:MAG TPA: 23S rRNA (uracil(1939)-C(5))-methyltransferase RlmD [Steroidobacteraceae bacterium]|jgi:23S rRNA (uracil1939-C5)-methyltransferase|nr:23S rRNA (uracil(1939)-C(5))-methyltransferase RlmD [Steroidobacteraceae bacterium]